MTSVYQFPCLAMAFTLASVVFMAEPACGSGDALLLIDPEVASLIRADSEAQAIFSGSTPAASLAPFQKFELGEGLLSEDEKAEIASIVNDLERKTGIIFQVVVLPVSEIGLASAKLSAFASLSGNEREECALLFDETGRQRTASFSPLMRFKRGGHQRLLNVLIDANRNTLHGSGARTAISTFLAAFERSILEVDARPDQAIQTDDPSAPAPRGLELQEPSISLNSEAALAEAETSGAEGIEQNDPEDQPIDFKPEALARMRKNPSASQSPPSPPVFTLDRAGWLLVFSTSLLLLPIVWAAIRKPIRRWRRMQRERKRLAELREAEQQLPSPKTLAAAAQENASDPEEVEAALLRKPKLRSRETTGAPRTHPSSGYREHDSEAALALAISYLRMLREAPEELRGELMDRLEQQLLAMKEVVPVVVRPHRKFEQSGS